MYEVLVSTFHTALCFSFAEVWTTTESQFVPHYVTFLYYSVFTFAHKLCNDVYGFLRHHGVQRHQFVVSQFLHDLSLLQEGFWRHGAWFQGLDSHLSSAIPRALIKTYNENKVISVV